MTAADVELMLDKLAWIMSKSKLAHMGAPLWRRLEAELAELREAEAIVQAARERAKRSKDQRAAQSC